MNKQEKEELVNQLNGRLTNCPSDSWDKGYNEGLMNAVIVVRNMHTADEPQKVKVPEEFDEWFLQIKQKWGKAAEQFALWKICQFGFGHYFEDVSHERTPLDLSVWVSNHKDEAVHAILKGYEVEEEPLYTVTINLDRKYHLVLDEGDGDDEISTTLTTGHDVLGYRYFLTEKEIKSADENLWPFAVPVEEVAE